LKSPARYSAALFPSAARRKTFAGEGRVMKFKDRFCIALILIGLFLLLPAGGAAEVQFESSDLPIVIIDTGGRDIPDEPKLDAMMKIIDNGQDARNHLADTNYNYNGHIGIEIRGSSSQIFPKKQYAIETRDDTGQGTDVLLLGLPAENDWILYAPYNDKSLIRNVLAYGLAREMGRYASRTRFCEVVLNGDYHGLYVLMEKIKRNKNRVDIAKLKTDSSDITGGYIIKIDKQEGAQTMGWYSAYRSNGKPIYYQYHYPSEEDITEPQKVYIQGQIGQFEALMAGPGYRDPANGYNSMIDTGSFVDFLILTEMARNVDGYRLSAFLYKDKDSAGGGKWNMGPLWDLDLAFGNANFHDGYLTSGWQLDFSEANDDHQIPFWWQQLRGDSAFRLAIGARWRSLRAGVLKGERINSLIEEVFREIYEAQSRNFLRWPVLDLYVWPNAFIGMTYEEEILYLKGWIAQRLRWLDGQWGGASDFCIPGDVNRDGAVDLTDAIAALQIISGRIPLPLVVLCTDGKAGGNGRIGLQEGVFILQKTAGMR
jgi:hypothetical protein